MLTIRPAIPDDYTAISILVVHAFGQNNEHKLIEALRRSDQARCELVAEQNGDLVGHICFSELSTPDNWWALAPVCVQNARQNQGIGGALIREGLDKARAHKAAAVVVVGDPNYYSRFGFIFGGKATLMSPYPAQYTGLYPIETSTATAQTALVYPRPFAEV
ncbi:MAG: GNAT family N-acetyltransferase [Mangrovicoccus sp.]